jgi:hypothetical protein
MRYELGFYIPEDGILHSHHRENLKFFSRLKHPNVESDIDKKGSNIWYLPMIGQF